MKKAFLLLAVGLLASAPVFSQKKTEKKPVRPIVSLAEAVSKNLVSLKFAGPGGHSQLNLTVENAGGSAVKVRIPQGQLFVPANGGEQNLVAAEEQVLFVAAQKSREVLLKTFCTEPSDASPGAASGFTVGAMAVEPVLRMLKHLSETGKLADPSAQSAVWSVCENSNFSPAGIDNQELTRQACQILNRRPPNYRVRYETVNTPGRPAFEGKAMVVDGNYSYYLARDEKLTLTLFDSEGKALKVLYKDKPYTAGEHRASLHLEVKGLKQGKYAVKLTTGSGEVVQEQEVEF